MWPYYPELLSRPVPRYTSYPTAAEFHEGVGPDDYATALRNVAPGTPLSLYLHIPFCEQICWYCGCNTGAASKAQRLAAYLDALEAELALVAKYIGGRGFVQRIAFGGGSPNALSTVEFVRLLDRIITVFAAGQPEISVEIDPRGFTSEWALVMAASNVSRRPNLPPPCSGSHWPGAAPCADRNLRFIPAVTRDQGDQFRHDVRLAASVAGRCARQPEAGHRTASHTNSAVRICPSAVDDPATTAHRHRCPARRKSKVPAIRFRFRYAC